MKAASAFVALAIASLLVLSVAADKLWAWDAKHARLDPQNKRLSKAFATQVIQHFPNLNIGKWAVPVVMAHEGDPMYSVSIKKGGWNCLDEQIRIPIGTKQEQSSDASLVIIDTVTGREHDLYQAVYDPQTRRIVSAQQGYSLNHGANGPSGANAAGFATSHGLITCDMFLKGKITTTMIWETTFADPKAKPRYPANVNYLTPEKVIKGFASGIWLRLDPHVNVKKIKGLKKWERIVAVGLQTHGMILRDTGGTFCISGRSNVNGGAAPWSKCGFNGDSVGFSKNFPWKRMQVLQPPKPPTNPVDPQPAKCRQA